LVEEGTLDLDAPAREYAPAIGELQVLEGFDADGQPRLRAPARDITTRHLLTHTAGFGYAFFSEDYRRLARDHGQPSVMTASHASLRTPLLFDPGARWEYGTSMDWAGLVVEGITGERLGETLRTRLFEPLGMDSTAFRMTDDMRRRRAPVHLRAADGSLSPMSADAHPADPEIHMAGHGLYGTATDYLRFIRMWLDDGAGPDGERILRPETVAMASRNHLPHGMHIRPLPSVDPRVSNDVEFFPGMPKSWALTFMVNEQDAPTGRAAGSLAWAGLANLYFWIDRTTGIGGFWATQILPFADPTSVGGYLALETAVYRHVGQPA
jgi:methyl acetate hydrolase